MELSEQHAERFVMINGEQDEQHVFNDIKQVLDTLIQQYHV